MTAYVKSMLTNPIYTGMGPYSVIVELELWLDVNVKMIAEEGSQIVIKSILQQFKEVFPCFQTPDADPFIQLAMIAPRIALHRLLADLNQALESPPVSCLYRNLQDTRRTMTDEQAVESFLQIVAQIAKRLAGQDDPVHFDTSEP